jgi:glycerophosphoryl diester phosphodiesterase
LPDVPRALALHNLPVIRKKLAKEGGVQILHVKDGFLTAEALDRISRVSLEIAVAAVNNPCRARFLINNGVQSVITDHPTPLLPEAIDGHKAR